jgi:thiol-disulfide isomerase/thioredoxin
MMRKIFLSTLLVTVALSATVAAGADFAETGAKLRNHPLQDLAGEPLSLADFRGEVLVVNFWASWCAPCLRELPVLDEWNTAWQDAGARVIAVSIDSKVKNAREFVASQKLGLTVCVDGPQGLAAKLDLPAVPTSYVIDQQGNVVLRIEGSSAADLARMQQKVQALLGSKNRRPKA